MCGCPAGESVGSTRLDVDQQTRMLEVPRVDGNAATNPRIQAEAWRPEHADDKHHTGLYSAVGLGIVGRRCLAADLLDMLDAHTDELESPCNQRTDGGLIVALDNQLGVAELLHDLDDEACNKVLLIRSFARHDVCKHALGAGASDGNTFN